MRHSHAEIVAVSVNVCRVCVDARMLLMRVSCCEMDIPEKVIQILE